MVILADTDEEAQAKIEHYKDGADMEALENALGDALADAGGTTAQRQPAGAQSCATKRYIAARIASGSWSRKPAAFFTTFPPLCVSRPPPSTISAPMMKSRIPPYR